jgi:hypothetical protein
MTLRRKLSIENLRDEMTRSRAPSRSIEDRTNKRRYVARERRQADYFHRCVQERTQRDV